MTLLCIRRTILVFQQGTLTWVEESLTFQSVACCISDTRLLALFALSMKIQRRCCVLRCHWHGPRSPVSVLVNPCSHQVSLLRPRKWQELPSPVRRVLFEKMDCIQWHRHRISEAGLVMMEAVWSSHWMRTSAWPVQPNGMGNQRAPRSFPSTFCTSPYQELRVSKCQTGCCRCPIEVTCRRSRASQKPHMQLPASMVAAATFICLIGTGKP
mmetsp:Transcript_5553/g.12610  ORF Transcript_5553/g.12610 Transcript_5553/m.12610 type:complete len:212 (+) Transcript_5553:924-1559(+)